MSLELEVIAGGFALLVLLGGVTLQLFSLTSDIFRQERRSAGMEEESILLLTGEVTGVL
jgi:hypothetical protein